MNRKNLYFWIIAALTWGSVFWACAPTNQNNNGKSASKSSSATTANPGYSSAPSASASTTLVINNITLSGAGASASPAAGGGSGTFLIYFDSSNSASNVTTVCSGTNTNAGTLPCLCRFTWNEINPSTGIGVTRTADTSVTQPYQYSLTCPAPTVWDTEIPEGTQVTITIAPDTAKGNTTSFTVNSMVYTKQSTVSGNGDFRDAEGKAIKNVSHYTCYDYMSKGLAIEHTKAAGSPRTSGASPPPAPQVPIANYFNTSASGISAQSYWYDFYVRSSETGSIVPGINGMTCPKVKVNKSGTITSQHFPLDSTFALALQQSKNYPIQVLANTVLNNSGQGSGAVVGTLGYAAKPNSDGTCPAFADSTGLTRRTFRLRRYIVNYPLRYDANGSLLSSIQPTNTVYIMDRPVDKTGQDPLKPYTRLGPKPCPFSFKMDAVAKTSSTLTTSPVSHVCTVGKSKLPYSYMYSKMDVGYVTGATSDIYSYLYGMNDGKKYAIVGDNIAGSTRGSARTMCLLNGTCDTSGCAAAPPTNGFGGGALYDNLTATCNPGIPDTSDVNSNDFVSLKNIDGTLIDMREECPIYPPPAANLTSSAALHIRPTKGWVLDFLEDTTFKACAFQSSQPVDPDLVVVYNGYQTRAGDRTTDDPKKARGFYCARTYPDPDWIEPSDGGGAPTKVPGTCDSGRSKSSSASNPSKYYIPKRSESCAAGSGVVQLASAYVTSSPSRRTVPDAQITSYAIVNERSYACAFTYNPTMKKSYDPTATLTDLTTPRSGCCQRCSGSSKSGNCTLTTPSNTAENRGIHSLVLTTGTNSSSGPWYNRYNKPAFTMQSVLLSAAPYQLKPNQGSIDIANACFTTSTNTRAIDAQFTYGISAPYTVGGTTIFQGSGWSSETAGTPMGCYDPSEDP